MPQVSGPEATKWIREEESNLNRKHTPIIAVTADAMVENLKGYLSAGMNAYVAKPIEISELLMTINDVMGERVHVPLEEGEAPAGPEQASGEANAADPKSPFGILDKHLDSLEKLVGSGT